jgi:hypothetical protein
MAGFRSIGAYPVYPSKIYLSWVLDTTVDPGEYTYKVYRSGAPEGPWESLTKVAIPGAPMFLDENSDLLSKYREVYYYVEAISGRGTVYTSPVKNLVKVVDRYTYIKAVEINRNEMLLLRQYAGVEVHIFKKKHFGDRCKVCYENVTKTLLDSSCLNCNGTGFEGGYYRPIKTYAAISPDSKVKIEQSDFALEVMSASAWLTAYPILNYNDLVVEADSNRRWLVKGVRQSELRRFPVKQEVQLSEVPRSEVEYTLPLDYCVNTVETLNETPDHQRPTDRTDSPYGVDVQTPR